MFDLNNFDDLDRLAITNFQEYLRVPSVHPNIDYDLCVKFLKNQAKSLNLPCNVYYYVPKKPVVLITWSGTDPSAKSILLNSHMDVVPVFEDNWTYKPFDAHIDEKGNIYARGTQDMKCVGVQYLEAIRRLKQSGTYLRRTLHISFVPDEEIGGAVGMQKFVESRDFKILNVGFALDEGMASANEVFRIFYGERNIWQFNIHCPGQPGHAALLLENTAGEKLRCVLDKFSDFRREQKQKLISNPNLTVGDVTSVNVTMIQGGVLPNVIPEELIMLIDCRMPVTLNIKEWEKTILSWCKEAGEDVWIKYEQKQPQIPATPLNDSNEYWMAFKKAFDNMNLLMKLEIFPAGTDCRYLREIGIPALGFSPMYDTPILLHDHNEYLNVYVFLRGIQIYIKLLTAIANCN
ncbi:hypothetical protein FQA39_LY11843 [Lamprigera yunnana]|nr:hypothetical protein FQA39_LY11843 [Lamprigera yunnana]